MQIIWLTDIHLDHITAADQLFLLKSIISASKNNIREKSCVVITGDIGNSQCTKPYMETWKNVLDKEEISLYFVFGNHDFYGSGVKVERDLLTNSVLKDCWLGSAGRIKLSDETTLIGHDGWYDGGYANWFHSNVDMNDYYHIYEISRQWWSNEQIFAKMNELAKESATFIYEQGTKSFEDGAETLFIATHIPPFRENSVFMDKISDDNWMPHFSSKHMGDAIIKLAEENPKKKIQILCGHSHGEAKHMPRQNVVCRTAEARYKYPKISNIFAGW